MFCMQQKFNAYVFYRRIYFIFMCFCTFLYILCAVCHHVRITLFLPNIYLQLQLQSCFVFTLALYISVYRRCSSNHKSQANPRVFAVYTLSPYEEHHFLLSRLIFSLRYVFPRMSILRVFPRCLLFQDCPEENAYRSTISDSYREMRCLRNSLRSRPLDIPFVHFCSFAPFGIESGM